jgi:hypothetical protein
VSGKPHAPDALHSGERTFGTYWMGGWEEPRTGVNDVETKKTCPYRESNSDLLDRPAHRQSLYRLVGTTDKLCSFLELISKELTLLAEVKPLVAEQTSHKHNPRSRFEREDACHHAVFSDKKEQWWIRRDRDLPKLWRFHFTSQFPEKHHFRYCNKMQERKWSLYNKVSGNKVIKGSGNLSPCTLNLGTR